jgi:2-desacetyl-2-hydroxyethyl bacteriochlorophyllide A dehydrogenase
MRQAVMTQPGAIELRTAAEPVPGPGQVLLRIRRIGVCGSDIHVFHGKHPFTSYPVVQGHEYSGTVEAVGPGVTRVGPGMKATARPQIVCGKCGPCRRGDYNICDHLKVQGFQAPGCAQDLFVVDESRVVRLADGMSYEQGALVEPVAVAAHSTGRGPDLSGRNVVVLGAGTIGNLVAQAARCRGAAKVLITDLSEFRLQKAKACGVDAVCHLQRQKLADAAREAFGAEGFDVAFEAVGAEGALDDAVQNIQKGGDIVVLGVFGERPRVDMSIVGDRELRLIGTLMYKHEDYDQAVRWIGSGAIKTEPLVTGHFAFEQYLEAYHFIEKQGDRTLKVMIDVA